MPGETLLDLGCGWGELLHRWLDAHETATATGIDQDEQAIERARAKKHPRATFVCGDAAASTDRADVIACVGASHAFGGTDVALRRLRGRSRRLLFGDGFWISPPSLALIEMFGPLRDRDGLRAACEGHTITSFEESTLAEWDAFESAWSDVPERVLEYGTYRGVLGFAWILLDEA